MPSADQVLEQLGVASSKDGEEFVPASLFERKHWATSMPVSLVASMAIAIAVLVPSRMLWSRGEPDDNAVFAYIGWAMKHGLMPYRDVWDHKGPLLYYLQFSGMSLRSASTFGIGLLELIALAAAFFLLFRVITSFASRFVSIAIAALSVVFVTHFYAGGNMCESWALLPLAAAHYGCWRWSQRPSQNWWAPVVAASFVSIFWLRPNMGAYPAVAMLSMLWATNRCEGFRTAIKQAALAIATALVLTALILAPLYRWGVFHDFVAAYFGYNAAYSGAVSLAGRFLHTQDLLTQLFAAAITILGTAGWALGLSQRATVAEVATIPSLYLRTLLWSLPFEVAAATLSGRDYPHYLLPLFSTLAVLAAWFLSEFENFVKVKPAKPTLMLALLVGLCPISFSEYLTDSSHSLQPPRSDYAAIAHFIQRATTANDRMVVVGGVEAAYITFLSQRLPGSRFVYQYALIDTNNPMADSQRKQFICELESNRPAVIVSGSTLLGVLCVLQADCNAQSKRSPANDYGYNSNVLPKLLKNLLASHYRLVDNPAFGETRVYLRSDIALPTRP